MPLMLAALIVIFWPPLASAEIYECQSQGQTIYTERPLTNDCRPTGIQPAQPSTAPSTLQGQRQFGDWPEAQSDTQAKTCALYAEWVELTQKGVSISQGIGPRELLRRQALDPIFAGRPAPNCAGY